MRFSGRSNHQVPSSYVPLAALAALVAVALTLVMCGRTTITSQVNNGMATVNVSISDPPSCSPPAGNFRSVFITIRSVQAHTSATADDNSSGWVELVPELNTQPVQVDLLNLPANGACLLKTLGSNSSLPAGDYQKIRLLLADNSSSSAAFPSNACATLGNVFNCVVDSSKNTSELLLSSQANTGLKIPPGQVVGGPIHIPGGTDVDALPLVAETGTTKGPGTIQGVVTALNGTAGANIDVSTSALQTVSLSVGATRPVTVSLCRVQLQIWPSSRPHLARPQEAPWEPTVPSSRWSCRPAIRTFAASRRGRSPFRRPPAATCSILSKRTPRNPCPEARRFARCLHRRQI